MRRRSWLILLVVFSVIVSMGSLSAQTLMLYDVDASAYPALRAHCLVLDSTGQQVAGIGPGDFLLLEDGQPRAVTALSCLLPSTLEALSAVLTLDRSSSMSFEMLDLAKHGARAFVRSLTLGPSDCAVTSFDTFSHFNRDFSVDSTELLAAIDAIRSGGQTSIDVGLIGPPAGALEVSRNARHRKVVLLFTDGSGTLQLDDEIIAEAQRQNAQIDAFILGNRAFPDIRRIAESSGGQVFDEIRTPRQCIDAVARAQVLGQGARPCTIEWISQGCATSRTLELQLPQYGLVSTVRLTIPQEVLPRLQIAPSSELSFGAVVPGLPADRQFTLSAAGGDVRISQITVDQAVFELLDFGGSPPPFDLAKGEQRVCTLRFSPSDTAYVTGTLACVHDGCGEVSLHVDGGKPPGEGNLNVLYPNGGERLPACSWTTIEWGGIATDAAVCMHYSYDGGQSWILVTDSAAG